MRSELEAAIPFSVPRERLPKALHRRTAAFLSCLTNVLVGTNVPTLDALLCLPPTKWKRKSTYLNMYLLGTFRKPWPIVRKVSKVLAPAYAEFLVLPVLHPIPSRIWRSHVESKTRLCRELARKGVIVYLRQENSLHDSL